MTSSRDFRYKQHKTKGSERRTPCHNENTTTRRRVIMKTPQLGPVCRYYLRTVHTVSDFRHKAKIKFKKCSNIHQDTVSIPQGNDSKTTTATTKTVKATTFLRPSNQIQQPKPKRYTGVQTPTSPFFARCACIVRCTSFQHATSSIPCYEAYIAQDRRIIYNHTKHFQTL